MRKPRGASNPPATRQRRGSGRASQRSSSGGRPKLYQRLSKTSANSTAGRERRRRSCANRPLHRAPHPDQTSRAQRITASA